MTERQRDPVGNQRIEAITRLHIPLLMRMREFISLRDVAPKTLTSQQVMAILLVGRQPGISLSELARKSKVTHGTMVVAIQKLVKKGLLQRKENPEDGRSVLLSLSPKGAQIPIGIQKEMHRRYKKLCEALSEDTIARLARSMEFIMETLSNE